MDQRLSFTLYSGTVFVFLQQVIVTRKADIYKSRRMVGFLHERQNLDSIRCQCKEKKFVIPNDTKY